MSTTVDKTSSYVALRVIWFPYREVHGVVVLSPFLAVTIRNRNCWEGWCPNDPAVVFLYDREATGGLQNGRTSLSLGEKKRRRVRWWHDSAGGINRSTANIS